MRLFLCWVALFSVATHTTLCNAAPRLTETFPKASKDDLWNAPYQKTLQEERRQYNRRSNLEKIVGGVIAFSLGTYGYYNDSNRKIVGKLIYSATQSGGIIALSGGIVGLSASSPVIAVDDSFQQKGQLDYEEYKRIVVQSSRASELAEIQKTAISTGLLAVLYGYNCYKERRSSQILRNTFGFLSFNFTMFSGVSFYRWITFDSNQIKKDRQKVVMSWDHLNSLSLTYNF